MGSPEKIGIETIEQFFQSAAVGLSFHAARTTRHHRDNAIFNGRETDVFLIHQEQSAGRLQKDFRGCGFCDSSIRISVSSFSDDEPLPSILARARSTDWATRFLSKGLSR